MSRILGATVVWMRLIALLLSSFALHWLQLEFLVMRTDAELWYKVQHRVQDSGIWRGRVDIGLK